MYPDKAQRAENTRWAIAVMTAYYAEDHGTALASRVATDYANEPNGVARLLDGFVHFSARLLLTVEEAGIKRDEALRLMAQALDAESDD